MKTICKHAYPSDLCGICNPIVKEQAKRLHVIPLGDLEDHEATNELFESMQTLSPRLKWMNKRHIYCVDTKQGFTAYRSGSTHSAFASTEDQACMELAAKLKIKSWKEAV